MKNVTEKGNYFCRKARLVITPVTSNLLGCSSLLLVEILVINTKYF